MSGARTPETTSDREHDVVPELPKTNEIAAAAGTGDAYHRHRDHSIERVESNSADQQAAAPSAFNARSHHHKRRGSSASRVAVDHFDPEGVLELKRTLTQQSATARSIHRSPTIQHHAPEPHSSSGSTVSTAVGDSDSPEKFDLEKTLREMVKRYV